MSENILLLDWKVFHKDDHLSVLLFVKVRLAERNILYSNAVSSFTAGAAPSL